MKKDREWNRSQRGPASHTYHFSSPGHGQRRRALHTRRSAWGVRHKMTVSPNFLSFLHQSMQFGSKYSSAWRTCFRPHLWHTNCLTVKVLREKERERERESQPARQSLSTFSLHFSPPLHLQYFQPSLLLTCSNRSKKKTHCHCHLSSHSYYLKPSP